MHRAVRPDGLDLGAGRAVRSHSFSSDQPSLSGRSVISPPPTANPEPAYIAASAASQLVSSELENDGMMVSQSALALLNSFLDQILFSILAAARSTQLVQLRRAVPEVLKPRLGREAVAGADEELKEYLGGGDDEEPSDFDEGQKRSGEFDLDLAWKLARLRCMVYTRLGDLEEDDEDEYIEQEQLDERGGGPRRYSSHTSSATPAAAIFLTSILEYLGEQALYYAGQAAQKRLFASRPNATASSMLPERMVLEEIDMFQVGRDSPLQRLWRTWRRHVRSPRDLMTRPTSRESALHRADPSTIDSSRKNSISSAGDPRDNDDSQPPSVAQVLDAGDATQTPLPTSAKGPEDPENEGLEHRAHENETASGAPIPGKANERARSILISHPSARPPTPTSSNDHSRSPRRIAVRPTITHSRSRSLPSPVISSLASPKDSQLDDMAFMTPRERSDFVDEVDSHEERGEVAEASSENAENVGPQDGPHEERSTALGMAFGALSAAAGAIGINTLAGRDRSEEQPQQTQSATNATVTHSRIERSRNSTAETESAPPDTETATTAIWGKEDHHRHDQDTTSELAASPASPTGGSDPENLALSSTDEESTIVPQRNNINAGFVLEPAPPRRSSRTWKAKDAGVYDQITLGAPVQGVQNKTNNGDQNGVPPLTPLREMVENARGTSDEASSTAASARARSTMPASMLSTEQTAFKRSRNSASTDSETSQHSSGSSKLSGFTRDQQGGSTASPAAAPGSVQQVSPPLAAQGTYGYQPPELTSLSDHKDQRPGTAGSQTSFRRQPVQNPPFSQPSSAVQEQRYSNEPDGKKYFSGTPLRTDQSQHHTLTPQNVRVIKPSDSFEQQRSQTQDLADFFRNTAPPGATQNRPQTSPTTASAKGINALRSHPPEHPTKGLASTPSPPPLSAAVGASTPSSPARPKSGNAQPRDPRIVANTTRDLADYAKSTGPENEQQLPVMLSSRPGTSATVKNSASVKERGGLPSASSPRETNQSTTSQKRVKPRIEARDPRALRNDTTSALIDLIREGPPRNPGEHRIPRELAPFRRTMDSDDLNALVTPSEKEPIGRSSVASTQDSSIVAKSLHSSSNSRTALLETSNRTNDRQANVIKPVAPNASSRGGASAEDSIRPKRKQRRVRDPYAIDSDDDDDDLVETVVLKSKSKAQEESLIDFLRNTSPPPEMEALPIATAKQSDPSAPSAQRKESIPSMRERLLRNTSLNGLNRNGSTKASNSKPKTDNALPSVRGTNTARTESPHLTQTGTKLDSYRPTKTTYAAHADRTRQKPKVAEQPKVTDQAKAIKAVGEVSDLRDFSKRSESPPIADAISPSPPTDEAGFAKFFSRRKKVAT